VGAGAAGTKLRTPIASVFTSAGSRGWPQGPGIGSAPVPVYGFGVSTWYCFATRPEAITSLSARHPAAWQVALPTA